MVDSPRGPIELNALRLVAGSEAAFRLTAGRCARGVAGFAHGAILVSEPLAWRLDFRRGSSSR